MNQGLSPGELAQIVARELERIPFPAVVLEVPSERIVAANPAATRLLDPAGGIVVGHLFEDFTSDHPDRGIDLFVGGHLDGFETFRVLHRSPGADTLVRVWIRSLDEQPPTRFVTVVIVAEGQNLVATTPRFWMKLPAVVGTADTEVMVDRISRDAEALFALPVSAILGTPLSTLVSDEDRSIFQDAFSRATEAQASVTVHIRIRRGVEHPDLRCEQIILPLQPPASCAFVFLPLPDGKPTAPVSVELSRLLVRLGRGAEIAQSAHSLFRGMTERTMPGLSRLTIRELEVLSRLVEGDRPPAIAERLFVSQSTIRNHLASMFSKLGVKSQRELLELFR